MPEIPVRIPVEENRISLEGMFQEGKNGRCVVICHPHPLYGGDMDNNVVTAARNAFAARGWGTLRYNFRGVGGSGGRPAQADKEASDLVAVFDYLRARNPGPLDLAAYSYGAVTALSAFRLGLRAESYCLFSPPLDFMSFEGLALPDRPTLITLGSRDGFCSAESLQKWLANQPQTRGLASLELIPGCDHFYWSFENDLATRIDAFLGRVFT